MQEPLPRGFTADSFSEPGLYLVFDDGKRVDLTHRKLEATANRFLQDPTLIPEAMKSAADYALCKICPARATARICHAIMPVLPFSEEIDDYMSYDRVTALYREHENAPLHVEETTMQRALVHISVLSLTEYCEIGLKFRACFRGINPLMASEDIAETLYANLLAEYEGDLEAIAAVVRQMDSELHVTAGCQVKRIQLICQNDVLTNAFVNAKTAASWLLILVEERIAAARDAHQDGSVPADVRKIRHAES